jgi:hypothetical protein
MVNRRSTQRVVVDQPCTLSVSGREVPALLVDLSEEGALFRIANAGQDTVSNDDLGMDASFLLASFSPPRQYTGEMIRLFIRDGARFAALRFWKKYKEVPAS